MRANRWEVADSSERSLVERYVERRIARKGLRPRVAASLIAIVWLIAIVAFGIVEHLVDPDSFGSVWSGMWWATQTVTTVGYGDVVPDAAAGQVIAALLMIGGLSLFAVVTGTITSVFVARAEAARRADREDVLLTRVEELREEVAGLRRRLDGSAPGREPAGGGDPPPP